MQYHKNDLIQLSWQDFETYISNIQQEISVFLQENNLTLDAIVPILRGGGIPAMQLAFSLNVVRVVPYQFKYVYIKKKNMPLKLFSPQFSIFPTFNTNNPTLLVVEGNHSTGSIANLVIKDIRKQLPHAKILYVSLTKDYFYKDSVKNVEFTTCALYTNENQKISVQECKKLGIKHKSIYVFPWENVQEEIASLNAKSFEYMDLK